MDLCGIFHFSEEGKLRDENKDKALSEVGYTVFRLADNEELKSMAKVKLAICEKAAELRGKSLS